MNGRGIEDVSKILKDNASKHCKRDRHYCIHTFTTSVYIKMNLQKAKRYVETCSADDEYLATIRKKQMKPQNKQSKQSTEELEKEKEGEKEKATDTQKGAAKGGPLFSKVDLSIDET